MLSNALDGMYAKDKTLSKQPMTIWRQHCPIQKIG